MLLSEKPRIGHAQTLALADNKAEECHLARVESIGIFFSLPFCFPPSGQTFSHPLACFCCKGGPVVRVEAFSSSVRSVSCSVLVDFVQWVRFAYLLERSHCPVCVQCRCCSSTETDTSYVQTSESSPSQSKYNYLELEDLLITEAG